MSRHDYDHAAALALYIALEPPNRTYSEVARRVGCNPATVAKWARLEDWDGQLQAAMQRGVQKALKSREERTAQLIRIYDRAADLVDAGLDPEDPKLSLDAVFAKFPEIHRLYRLETEQATDHVALAEVQAGLRTSMQVAIEIVGVVAGELLGEKRAGELVRAFRARFLPAVNEALAIGGGSDG